MQAKANSRPGPQPFSIVAPFPISLANSFPVRRSRPGYLEPAESTASPPAPQGRRCPKGGWGGRVLGNQGLFNRRNACKTCCLSVFICVHPWL